MGKSPGCFRALCILALLLPGVVSSRAQGQRSDREVKALLFVTLARYTEWPSNAFETETSPIVIGVIGENPFGDLLRSLTKDETVRGRKLQVTQLDSAEDPKCHMLFFGSMPKPRQDLELRRLRQRAILTVSDSTRFASDGGMIELYVDAEKKVRLKISKGAVARAGLTLSPSLIRVADPVASIEYVPDEPDLLGPARQPAEWRGPRASILLAKAMR